MEKNHSNFWIGLGIGSIIGAVAYRYSRTGKARKMKRKACEKFHKFSEQAAEKVADMTYGMAEKADDIKEKVHTVISDIKNGKQ